MLLGVVTLWETSLHGMELIPGLDLHRGQCYRHAMTNTMEGDFLNVGQDVLEVSVDEGTLSFDGVHARVRSSWRDSNCTIRADDHRK